MALLSRQRSLDGRTSRSPTTSVHSKALGPQASQGSTEILNAAAPGVLSMLKTSTDVGDVGEFSHNTGRLPAALRPPHQRRNHPSRLSNSSNQSAYTYHTNHSRVPSHGSRKASNAHTPQGWDAISAMSGGTGNGTGGRHGSMVSLQTLATMPPYENRAPSMTRGPPRSSPYGPPYVQDGRSYSLTQSHHEPSLKPAKSVTSLRSQRGPQFQPPRPPFAYPPRHKRTGFRTPSPALSDHTGGTYQTSYNQSHPFEHDSKFLSDQPPNYFAPTDPAYYAHLAQPQESYQGPALGQSYGPAPGRGMHRPNLPTFNGDYAYAVPPGPRYTNQQPPMMPPPTQHNYQEPNYYGQYGPVAHALPSLGYGSAPRVGTPGMDTTPSFSRQGSSSPLSLNPPTPRDTTAPQTMNDPGLGQPTLSELPEEHSEYKSVQSYLRYTEQSTMYELDASQPAAIELEANTPTARRTGLVQRIRNLLEDRAASQEHLPSGQGQSQQDVSKLVVPQPFQNLIQEPAELSASKRSSMHEPVELDVPARITRQLIQANTAPSSSEQNTTTSLIPEETVKAKNEQGVEERFPESSRGNLEKTTGGDRAGHGLFLNYSDNQISGSPSEPNNAGSGVQIVLSEPLSSSNTTDQLATKDGDRTRQSDGDFQSGGVSPLRADERVVRDSVVSPMATQTLQITTIQEQPKILGPQSKIREAPLPDRSSRQTFDTTEMTSGISLPTGPCQTLDASPSSNHVTDVAIKFSIPRSSDHGKAQLVNLSNLSDTPVRTSMELKKTRSAEDNSLQSASLSSVEKVAPLRIRRMESFLPVATGSEGTDLSSFIRRSFPRKRSMWTTTQPDPNRSSTDSTTDLGTAMFKVRPGYLPDLNEDSKEDISTRNTKSSYTGLRLSNTPSLRLKPSRDAIRRSEDIPQQSYLSPRPPRMSLSELREIPSLNFSRMDLFDKLNEELETHISRSSKSLAGVKGERRSGPRRSLLLHPASTDQIRERYTSFFSDPEDSELLEDSTAGALDSQSQSETLPEKKQNDADIVSTKSFAPSVRPISTQQMLGMASEVNRLPVPSVAALSARLSTLLPTIKHLHIDCAPVDQTAVNDAIDRIHHLGQPEGEAAQLLRSSTGLHQLAAIADNIATNGTHDSAFLEVQKSGRLMKELPPLPEDTEKYSLSDSGLDRNTTLITEGITSTSELEPPKPALLRGKSLSVIKSKEEDVTPGVASRHSLVISGQNLRPWNHDENYPWCGNSPGIKIDFATPVLRRHSSPPKLVHTKSRDSVKTKSGSEETLDPNSTLPSSPMVSHSDTITPTVLTLHDRKSSKKSLIESLSRRIGLSTRAQSGIICREGALAGRASPGDRYPSTSLQSPHGNIEDVRSFFSDSTEEEHDGEQRGSFRKQITSFRDKSSKVPTGHVSTAYSQSLDTHRGRSLDQYGRPSNARTTGSLFDDRFTEPVAPQNYDGMVGMGRVEFRVKRVAERLRHIWLKGGEIIRSLSQRSRHTERQHRERDAESDNWLADSLYSRD